MNAFTTHTGVAAPLLVDNVDTDQIIPSREMKRVSKTGLKDGLFAGWRWSDADKTNPDASFVLNQPGYENTSMLLGGKNFGCGSSREHAVWALREFGIRVVIAESFGRIFRNNCARNGMLAIRLPHDAIVRLVAATEKDPASLQLTVDLVECTVTSPDGIAHRFEMDGSDRNMLIKGLDYIDFTLQFEDDIARFIASDRDIRPWAYLAD